MADEMTQILIEHLGKKGIVERLSAHELGRGILAVGRIAKEVAKAPQNRAHVGDDSPSYQTGYNALGAIYPYLTREQRNIALGAIVKQLEGVNTVYVGHNHTRFIREPLLLADITIVRAPYWPGLEQSTKLIGEHKQSCQSFGGLMHDRPYQQMFRELMCDGLFFEHKVDSDFLVALALLKDNLMCAQYTQEADSDFLYRTIKGWVAINTAKTPEQEIPGKIAEIKSHLPKALHERVDYYAQEKDWVN